MKKVLLIALLLAPLVVDARVLMETKNRGSGKMVLTDEPCRNEGYNLAYSVSSNTSTLLGCYTYDESFVHIQWYDGDLRSYPFEVWTVKRVKPNI
jgi:hypothetical protein